MEHDVIVQPELAVFLAPRHIQENYSTLGRNNEEGGDLERGK